MHMNSIKRGLIISVVFLSQILLNPCVLATEEYSNTNELAFSQAELAQLLAPIALYPDSLLTHIVIASTYPLEVIEAFRWLEKHSQLETSQAVNLAQNQGWDASVTALVAFPNVLARLHDDITWTQNLGNAFLEDEERVLDTIQVLREQAMQANSLNNLQNMTVSKVNQQIIIQPAQKEIVYVPYYDTRVVYGNWYWHRNPPVYWTPRSHLSVHFPTRISGLFHWHRGINISFNYHFSAFKWANRHIVVINHHQARTYRSYSRIASSSGAKRWSHAPSHRRGVAYRSDRLKSHYNGHKSTTLAKRSITRLNNHRQYSSFDKNTIADRSHVTTQKQNKHNNHKSFADKLARNNRYTQSSGKEERSNKQSKHFERETNNRRNNRPPEKLDGRLVEQGNQQTGKRHEGQNYRQVNKQQVLTNRLPGNSQGQIQNKKSPKEHSQDVKKNKLRKRPKD